MSGKNIGYWEDKVRKINMQIHQEGFIKIWIFNKLDLFKKNSENEIEELKNKGKELQKELTQLVWFE